MTFTEFTHLARSYNVIPVSTTLLADTLTPVSAYLRLREDSTGSFLFESVEGGERFARYSFIGRDPIATLACRMNTTTVTEHGITRTSKRNFFELMGELTASYRQPALPDLPRFTGGLVGFIGYDTVRFIEDIPCRITDVPDAPDSILALFTSLLVFDHLKHQITIIVNVLVDPKVDTRSQFDAAISEIRVLEQSLRAETVRHRQFRSRAEGVVGDTSPEHFFSMVSRAKKYITEGDIFQVVLSQRFSAAYTGDLFNVYRALRVINPSPYLYYIDFEDFTVIGSSPEMFVRVENGFAETYPIAGTRPRGGTDEEDRRLEIELLADEKERAEHVMLVDLGRNDIGKVCEPGSVKVEQFMFIVRYSHVMHIASRVVGKMAEGKTCIDALKAAFPAGTVSGAPKIRAMEIIDELEQSRRGMYAGCIGYFDFSGNMDMCIAIRTMCAYGGNIHFQAGAGIVADSDPAREYQEMLNKARALIESLRKAEEITG